MSENREKAADTTRLKQSRSQKQWQTNLVAAVAGVGYGLLMTEVFKRLYLNSPRDTVDLASFAFLVLVPLGIGVMAAAIVPAGEPVGPTALLVTFLFLLTSALLNSVMILCILITAPLWIVPGLGGALLVVQLRGMIRKPNRQRAYIGVLLLLPLMFAPIESYLPAADWIRTIDDSIVIEGTPEHVWTNIIRMNTINPEEQRPSLYHSLGIPRPIRATLDREAVGGTRIGEFEFGLTFRETITVWEPYERVAFDVDVLTNSRDTDILAQIGGRYFDIIAAGYEIEPLEGGRVRLKLNSTYRLSTHFNFYGVLWSDWIMHDFQAYVLQTVKARVERMPLTADET